MAEDTPKNLRKFLESDDPAMVLMGLSMAKGAGVPEELLPTILGIYMWDDDQSVRTAARTMFFKHAPAEIQAKVKENWKASYRTLSISGDRFPEAIRQFLEAFKSQDVFSDIALEPLIKALGDGNSSAVWALGKIGDARAVEPLIKALGDEDWYVGRVGILCLDFIHGRQEVKQMSSHIYAERIMDADRMYDGPMSIPSLTWAPEAFYATVGKWARESAAVALAKIGEPAVEPLIKALGDEEWKGRAGAASVLGGIGDERAVEPLIKALEDEDLDWQSAKALGEIGDSRAVEPLIKALGDDGWPVRMYAAEALGKIGDTRAVDPLIDLLLGDDERDIHESAAIALGVIGDERAVADLVYCSQNPIIFSGGGAVLGALRALGR